MMPNYLVVFSLQAFIIFSGCSFLTTTTAQYVEVTTSQGILQGIKTSTANIYNGFMGKTFYKFVGIPYTQPPVGPLRFKPPQPPLSWKGVKAALTPPSPCLQFFLFLNIGKEDCLYLNVYTPQLPLKNNQLPLKAVMVWIHGGYFRGLDGYNIHGPDNFITNDVLLVTLNYRLGVLGFTSLENKLLSGNYGLKDQTAALKWVQENIKYFGGDPKNVTIFGGSAGAACVHYHILSPLSAGLFQQAIVQSGTAVNPWAFNQSPKKVALRLSKKLGYNTTNINQLYNMFMNATPSDLVEAGNALFEEDLKEISSFNPGDTFLPCVEVEGGSEAFITESPRNILQKGNFNKVPLIMGTLNADGIIPLAFKKHNDKDFKSYNEGIEWVLPKSWNLESGRKEQAAKKMKKYYFQNNNVSFANIQSLVDLTTDVYFVMDTQFSLSAHLNNSNFPVYNYEFTLETSRSSKLAIAIIQQQLFLKIKGAAHGDDLPMLFTFQGQNLDLVAKLINAPFFPWEQKIRDMMIAMWTTFAKKGDPNYPGLEINWKPLKKNEPSYLEIGSTLKVHDGKVRQQNLDFLKTLCEDSSATYACGAL